MINNCFFTLQLQTEKYCLRALGDDPRNDIANIHEQFPDLAEDIKFSDFYPKEGFFSNVLKLYFLVLIQDICWGYSKEPSH